MEENETSFAIPANYTDSGKFFAGMLSLRNIIETTRSFPGGSRWRPRKRRERKRRIRRG